MGDRFLVGFKAKPESTPMWLYSHWGGSERHEELAEALVAAEPRWSDHAYATRIVISNIVGMNWNEETGFGLTVGNDFVFPDYGDIAVIVWGEQKVYVIGTDDIENSSAPLDGFPSMTFDEFLTRVRTKSLA